MYADWFLGVSVVIELEFKHDCGVIYCFGQLNIMRATVNKDKIK